MKNQLISIIVPVYNVADYLDECMESIVNQTYQNFELIVVDDGSTDGSSDICDWWQKKDTRIKVIHTENYGVSRARNIGLSKVTGDYVGFVDADDWVELDTYECLLQAALTMNADASGGGYIREEKDGGIVTLRKDAPKVFSRTQILREIFSCDNPKLLYWELCDKLFKRELINGISFDEDIGAAEDKLFFWKIMQRANNFAYVPLFKYHYRMRDGSAVHSGITPKVLTSLYAERRIWHMCQEEQEDLRKLILRNYMSSLLVTTCQMLLYDAKQYKKDIIANQKELRVNLSKIPAITWRRLLGIVFLCLPYTICSRLVYFIKNDIN